MRYSSRSLQPLAFAVYLVMVMFLPMSWLTHPGGTPTASRDSEYVPVARTRTAGYRWKRDIRSARPLNRYGISFREGMQGSNGNYSWALVISRLASEDVSWASIHLPHLDRYVYTTNDANVVPHTPQNKGHEVMVYLTHLVEHYDDLADINVFMHKDRFTHHNEALLDFDAVKMVSRLRGSYVVQNGYTNLQCGWAKSCPSWLNSSDPWPRMEKQEQVYLSRVWKELFPGEDVPATLGAPCCAQYAVSKERIRAVPLARFVFVRDWLLKTPLTDYISGRLWEYLWHYLFTGEHVKCPLEHVCLCDGYGICFGGEEGYGTFRQLKVSKEALQQEMDQRGIDDDRDTHKRNGTVETVQPVVDDTARQKYLAKQIRAIEQEQTSRVASAVAQGDAKAKQARLGTNTE